MSEGKERANARLENLQAIEPLLASLRVLSLSTMQMAMNRQTLLDQYAERFNQVASQVKRTISRSLSTAPVEEVFDYRPIHQEQVLAVIGSTLGIVGQYNKNLVAMAKELSINSPEVPVKILAFGQRVHTVLKQEGLDFTPSGNLSSGSLPDYDNAATLIRTWDKAFEAGSLTKVTVLSYKRKPDSNDYQPVFSELLPNKAEDLAIEEEQEAWPPPIIDGDPALIFEKIESHIIAIQFYRLILDSVAAENKFRFQLLEEAKENTSTLLEELTLEVQANRRKEITQQLQELLVGSGMLAER